MDAAAFDAECRRIRENKRLRWKYIRAGQLWWLLHAAQFQMYQQFYSSNLDQVWDCARRLGKTYLMVVLALECCLRKKRARVALGAAQAVDVEDIIEPIVEEISEYFPPDLRPQPRWGKHRINFSNGSVIKVAGCDAGNYKHLRGRGLDLWLLDEAGFMSELAKVADDVLSPQTWTTGGRGIIGSTPSDTTAHAFQAYYLAAKAQGCSARFTFDQNPMLSPQRRLEIVAKEAAKKRMTVEEFKATTVYRREFCAEFVMEETRAVLPELNETLAELLTVPELSTPLFADWYTVTDLGGSRDPTGIMVGYYDFRRKRFRVQRGKLLRRPTTEQIAVATKELERAEFGLHREDGAAKPLHGTHFRIIDDPLGIVARDLAQKYGLASSPPQKEDKDSALMDLRDSLQRHEVEFSPEVREVLAQCQAAIWNKRHTEFERVDGFGHFEFVDCLLYASRNYIRNRGRVPPLYGVDLANAAKSARAKQQELSPSDQVWSGVFGG